MTTPEALREQAAASEREAQASWERSDTDGFMSQWAHGLTAQRDRAQADLIEAGGTHRFLALFSTAGHYVPARRIEGKYGAQWLVLDELYAQVARFLPYHPKRRETLAKRGFVEGYVTRPAEAVIEGRGYGMSGSAWVEIVPTDEPSDYPTAILTADRWADEETAR